LAFMDLFLTTTDSAVDDYLSFECWTSFSYKVPRNPRTTTITIAVKSLVLALIID
jgi:hypothetical protein